MSEGKTQVLDLDAELVRSEITFKGKQYELRNRSELSILETNRLARMRQEYSELVSVEAISDEDAEKIGVAVHEVAAMLLAEAPTEEVPDQLCMKIMRFWSEQYVEDDDPNAEAEVPPPPRPLRAPQDRKPKQTKKPASTGAK